MTRSRARVLAWTAALAGPAMLALVPARADPLPAAMNFAQFSLTYDSPLDAALQARLEAIDTRLRAARGMTTDETALGVLDLRTLRLAMVRPDRIEYAASVPKIAILLAWFHARPEPGAALVEEERRELGRMIKVSDNAIAAKYSERLGLARIQEVLQAFEFYDASRGGGIWLGKHYGKSGERLVDPVGGHSHGATVRQLLRFYLLLEQGSLISTAASQHMRAIFASPEIPHRDDKFVRGLAGRDVRILRKAGWWQHWFHDSAIVTGSGRHYILVALTRHVRGDDYLVELAAAVDDLLR